MKDATDIKSIEYSFQGWDSIRQGFADNEMASNDHLDFFALCLMDDDKTFRKNNHQSTQGFRIVLPLNFIVSNDSAVLF